MIFDPNQHPELCEKYMSRSLGSPVRFLRASALTQSSRMAPWRVDVEVSGVERAYVLQLDPRGMDNEYHALKALEALPIRTPRVYGYDAQGEALGTACFFADFVEGESLLAPMLAGDAWAETLYLDTVCGLMSITEADLGDAAPRLPRTTAANILEDAYASLKDRALPLAETSYQILKNHMPAFPPLRFSNGDLWLDNFITRDQKLAGVIDFPNAGFSDPAYEFLLSFFFSPELRGRGIEERFYRRIGADPAALPWYHGLEFFEAWAYLLRTGETFGDHTAESVGANLAEWVEQDW